MQHMVAHGGKTEPRLFHAAMTSSTYLLPQYLYNDTIPEVSRSHEAHSSAILIVGFRRYIVKSWNRLGENFMERVDI